MNKTKTDVMNHPAQRRGEAGQAIVLIALVMLALVAFLGLAIDGGGLFLLWRQAQNATDAAALAAAYAKCTNSPNWALAGLDSAAKNGFSNDGSSNIVTVNNPPKNGDRKGDLNFVEVVIEAVKPSYFIQVVYKEPLKVTNSAVGLCYPPFDATKVGGLWAGSDHCQNTVDWSGSESHIWGGMFSNYEITLKGTSGVYLYDLVVDGVTYPGTVGAVNFIEGSSSNNIHWSPSQDTSIVDIEPTGIEAQGDPLNLPISMYMPGGAIFEHIRATTGLAYDVSDPKFPGKQDWTIDKDGNGVWTPGSKKPYELHGLYYVPGTVDFATGGNKLTFNQEKDAYGNYTQNAGFTIVALGDIDVGNGDLRAGQLHYYGHIMDPVGPRNLRYPGVIFFTSVDETSADVKGNCGTNAIKFSGKTDVWGVIYAPKGGVQISGSSMQLIGSAIVNTINYSSANGLFKYDPNLMPPRPPAIQIAE